MIPRIVVFYISVWLGCWVFFALFHHHWAAYLLLWPAAVMTIVLTAYYSNAPSVLGKDAKSGTLNYGIVFLMLPFFLLVWGLWWVQIKRSKEPVYSRVTDDLFLGRYTLSGEGMELHSSCLTVDLTAEFGEPLVVRSKTNYRCVPMLDAFYPWDEQAYLDLISEAFRWKGRVCVHCAYGHGRSGAFVCILLVLKGVVPDIDSAVVYLKKIRPGVNLHDGQKALAKRSLDQWLERQSPILNC